MSSRIEQLIDEIEEYIDSCKPQFMSSTNIVVNKDEIDDLLRELRMKTPEEIKRYQKIVSNKEAILNDAKAKADALISEATARTGKLVDEHEIMQQAYAQAQEIVDMATSQAQEILDNATMEANSVRMAAMQYMDDLLAHADNVIASATQTAADHYEELVGSLNHYRDIIQSNRSELQPTEEAVDTAADTQSSIPSEELDVIS